MFTSEKNRGQKDKSNEQKAVARARGIERRGSPAEQLHRSCRTVPVAEDTNVQRVLHSTVLVANFLFLCTQNPVKGEELMLTS